MVYCLSIPHIGPNWYKHIEFIWFVRFVHFRARTEIQVFVSHLRYCINLYFLSSFYPVPFKQLYPYDSIIRGSFITNLITSTQLSRQYADALARVDHLHSDWKDVCKVATWLANISHKFFWQKGLFLLSQYFFLLVLVSVLSRGYSDTYGKNSGAGKDLQGNKFKCNCICHEPTQ